MKISKGYFVIFILGFLLFACKDGLITFGVITSGEVLNFDVDSEENIYIGTMNQIQVYKDGTLLRTIEPPTSRAYHFYIENDRLIIGCASSGNGGTYDLEGNELPSEEFSFEEIKDIASKKSINVNGHQYRHTNGFLTPYKITCDGVEVYRMPTLDYIFNGLPFHVVWAVVFISIVVFVLHKFPEIMKAKENGEDTWKVFFR